MSTNHSQRVAAIRAEKIERGAKWLREAFISANHRPGHPFFGRAGDDLFRAVVERLIVDVGLIPSDEAMESAAFRYKAKIATLEGRLADSKAYSDYLASLLKSKC